MTNKLNIFILGLGTLLVLTAGIFFWSFGLFQSSDRKISSKGKTLVTTSIYPLYFFINFIGGDKVETINLTPVGLEPHDYDLKATDLMKIEQSKILFLNGGIESWGDKIKNNLQGSKLKIVTVGEGLFDQNMGDGEVKFDPHVWLSPRLAVEQARKITLSLISVDVGNKTTYENNLEKIIQEFSTLDQQFKTGLQTCERRDFVTSHASFGYLAKDYALKQISLAGLSPDEEPSPKKLAEVAKFASQNNIKFIFFENLVSPKLSETLASEINAKTLILDPIEGVSLEDQKQGKNYFTIMRENLNNLRVAMNCQ